MCDNCVIYGNYAIDVTSFEKLLILCQQHLNKLQIKRVYHKTNISHNFG